MGSDSSKGFSAEEVADTELDVVQPTWAFERLHKEGFLAFDDNGNGSLSFQEFKDFVESQLKCDPEVKKKMAELMSAFGIETQEAFARGLFSAADKTHTNTLSFEELSSFIVQHDSDIAAGKVGAFDDLKIAIQRLKSLEESSSAAEHESMRRAFVRSMAAPTPTAVTLTYFDGPGRGELTRLCLHAGGIKFEDKRIPFDASWGTADKSSLPFGSMPMLEHGSFKIAQSAACAQYAAELGLTKNLTAQQRGTAAMFAGVHADMQSAMYKCIFGSDESKKVALVALPSTLAKLYGGVEKLLPGKGYVLGGATPSQADLAIFDNVTSKFPGLRALSMDMSVFPKVNALVAKVQADPCLKSYLSTRGF